jgi:hypothetical protein
MLRSKDRLEEKSKETYPPHVQAAQIAGKRQLRQSKTFYQEVRKVLGRIQDHG